MQFYFSDGGSYCTALKKMAAMMLSPANCEIPVSSDDGAGNLLKTEPMCKTKTVVADRPW